MIDYNTLKIFIMFIITEEEIRKKVKEIAERINEDYKNCDEIILIGILKGAFVFLADLMREIKIPSKIDFIKVSSYGQSTESSGIVRIELDTSIDITNRDVIIVEDILDTGLTLKYIKELFLSRNPKSLKLVVLLEKIKIQKEIFNNLFFGFLAIFLILIDFVLRRFFGFR